MTKTKAGVRNMEFCSLRMRSMNDDQTMPPTMPMTKAMRMEAKTRPSIEPMLMSPSL